MPVACAILLCLPLGSLRELGIEDRESSWLIFLPSNALTMGAWIRRYWYTYSKFSQINQLREIGRFSEGHSRNGR